MGEARAVVNILASAPGDALAAGAGEPRAGVHGRATLRVFPECTACGETMPQRYGNILH